MRSLSSAVAFSLVALAAALPAGPAFAQAKRLTLETSACSFAIRFDPKQISERAIRDTVAVLDASPFVFGELVDKPADAAKLLPKLEAECAREIGRWSRTAVAPGYEAQRARMVEVAEDACNFHRIQLRGYADPSILRTYAPAATCNAYVDALEGKTDLRAAFEALGKTLCRDNASPKACLAQYDARTATPDFIRKEMISFGWGNCANDFTLRATGDESTERAKLLEQFLKRFKAKASCEQ